MTEVNMLELGESIAAHLDGFTVGKSNHKNHVNLHSENGEDFYFVRQWNSARVEVSGDYPRTSDGGYQSPRDWGVVAYGEAHAGPHITFSATRDPAAIAKDIERRFLPRYTELYAACVEAKAKQDERDNARDTLLTELKALAPSHARDGRENNKFSWYDSSKGSGELTVNGKDVSIELRWIPVETAKAILALL